MVIQQTYMSKGTLNLLHQTEFKRKKYVVCWIISYMKEQKKNMLRLEKWCLG